VLEPSGWIDKRPLKKRVYFLRASRTPTVIIETHHALDPDEVARWDEPRTREVFSAAVAASILDFMWKR
jgi:N-acetylmuramoyl-L-alanine amidase